MTGYAEFIESKTHLDSDGFEPTNLPGHLFEFQRELVEWAVQHGRSAIFADCGLGKTPMELAWAEQVYRKVGKPVLLLTPLAVGFQIVTESEKFGHDAALSRNGKPSAPITVTNYEQVEKFDPSDFSGVVCDESSAIKAFDGERRAQVTQFMRKLPYRLLGTATAAPNDYMELGTSSEALGHLGYMDMLNRFFVNDQRTSDTSSKKNVGGKPLRGAMGGGWRFKGHAVDPFWQWVSSWARAIRKPSDYGYPDDGFHLPPLVQNVHKVEARSPNPYALFDMPAGTLNEEREENRRTVEERCECAAALLSSADHAVAWCNLNTESSLLTKLIDGAIEVSGSDSVDAKEEKLRAFSEGNVRVLVTKPTIGAWGLNWQHCCRMSYFPSHSYEQYYQSVRRCWRFGQKRQVSVDVVTTSGSEHILANINRKAHQADLMFDALLEHMNRAAKIGRRSGYANEVEVPAWL